MNGLNYHRLTGHLIVGIWVIIVAFAVSILMMPLNFKRGVVPEMQNQNEVLLRKIQRIEEKLDTFANKELTQTMFESLRKMVLEDD